MSEGEREGGKEGGGGGGGGRYIGREGGREQREGGREQRENSYTYTSVHGYLQLSYNIHMYMVSLPYLGTSQPTLPPSLLPPSSVLSRTIS